MTFTVHLGVIDFAYSVHVPEEQRRKVVRVVRGKITKPVPTQSFTAPPSGGETTGDVATILEDKYHIMQIFAESFAENEIQKAFDHSAVGALENIMMGAPYDKVSLTAEAEGEIEGAFKHFLSLQLMDGLAEGVPTGASLKGVNHRLKKPYAKSNGPRPSFIDTGQYQASFKAWTD